MSLLIRVFKLDAVKRNSELVSDHVKHGLENLLLDFESPFLVIKREKKKNSLFSPVHFAYLVVVHLSAGRNERVKLCMMMYMIGKK